MELVSILPFLPLEVIQESRVFGANVKERWLVEVDSPIRRLDAAKQKIQRHARAFTFYSELAIFSCLALRRRVFLVGIHEVHNFYTVTVFQSMRSSRLPASSAGHVGGKAERNREVMRDREALRNRRKLVRSRLNETVNRITTEIALEK